MLMVNVKRKLSYLEIKQALFADERFRALFPEFKKEIDEFIKNTGCPCNVSLYQKILNYKDRLQKYFPTREIETPKEEAEKLSKNKFKVINCHIDELETKLKKLPPGRKQIAVTRFEEQVTVIINDLEFLV